VRVNAIQAPPRGPDTPPHDWSPELLKAKAYEQILLDIIIGALAPGERLNEQALAASFAALGDFSGNVMRTITGGSAPVTRPAAKVVAAS
jgi:hypothetical protein